MRILVIEDERALCETIVRSLKRLAYSVDFAMTETKQMSCSEWKSTILFYLILIYPVQTG